MSRFLKLQEIIEKGQHVVQNTPVCGPDFIPVIADIFFCKMVDAQVFQSLTQHADLQRESRRVIATPV